MAKKSCKNCKNAIISGGDRVPYGSTYYYTPKYVECDNPKLPEDKKNIYDTGIDCQYHEFE